MKKLMMIIFAMVSPCMFSTSSAKAETFDRTCLESYAKLFTLKAVKPKPADKLKADIALAFAKKEVLRLQSPNAKSYDEIESWGYTTEIQAVYESSNYLVGFKALFYNADNGFGDEGDTIFYFYNNESLPTVYIGYTQISVASSDFELLCTDIPAK